MPFDDLFQVACLGLVNAIERFDLEREVAFSSYAVPTIVGEIKRYFRDRTWSVRVPRDLQDLALTVDRVVSELDLELHRAPGVHEIAAKSRRARGGRARGARGLRCLQGHLAADAMGHATPMAARRWLTPSGWRSAGSPRPRTAPPSPG